MNKVFALSIIAILSGCATTQSRNTSVTVEFRPGSQEPEAGLTAMMLPGSGKQIYISEHVVLSNSDIDSAAVGLDPNGQPMISIVFTKAGAERFAEVTEQNIGKPLAILIDGELLSAPIIQESILGGKAVITGSFSNTEAERIAKGIKGR